MRKAVRKALLQHKQEGLPVAVWRNDQVEWIAPEDIPIEPEPEESAAGSE